MFNVDGVDYIDAIENMYDKDMILIRGWAVFQKKDNSDICCKKHILLKSETKENIIYKMKVYTKQRLDVAAIFDDSTRNAASSGINVFFDGGKLQKGKYLIGVMVENNRRYVKWSTETIDIN
jgi:hypothetical protein